MSNPLQNLKNIRYEKRWLVACEGKDILLQIEKDWDKGWTSLDKHIADENKKILVEKGYHVEIFKFNEMKSQTMIEWKIDSYDESSSTDDDDPSQI